MTARRAGLGAAAVWLALVAAGGVASAETDEPVAADRWPRTVRGVWYRTGTDRGMAGPKLSGDLVITPESLEFLARKRDISIPFDTVRMISLGQMRGDVDTEWVVLSVQRGEDRHVVGLRDGRKLGYGARTEELYETLRETARRFSWAQFAAPVGFRPWADLDRVFAVAVPEGWSFYHHDLVSVDGMVRWGTVVFTPRPVIEDSAAGKERDRALAAIQRGHVTAWVIQRREARAGMGCEGISKGAQRTLGDWVADDPFLGGSFTLDEPPSFEPTPIGGCAGLRLVIRGGGEAPDTPALDLRIVAREGTVVLMALRSTSGELEREGETFERGVSTLTLAATR